MFKTFLFIAFLAIIAPLPTTAQNTYIVDLSGEGDFDTIHEAVEAASSGDTLLVQSDQFVFNNSLPRVIVDKQLAIIGTGFQTVDKGGTELIDPTGTGFFDIQSAADGTLIEGFRMISTQTSSAGYGIVIRDGANNVEVANSLILYSTSSGSSGNSATLIYTLGDNTLIRNMILFGGQYNIYSSGDNTLISNNIFGDRSTTGSYTIFEDASNLKIFNNIFIGIRAPVLYFTFATAEAFGNAFISNSTTTLIQLQSASPTIGNNGFFNNSDNAASSTDLDFSPILDDPLFENFDLDNDEFTLDFFDEGDFSFELLESSPYINAGRAGSAYNDTDGSRNDIGIFGGPYPFNLVKGGATIPSVSNFQFSPTTISPTGSVTIQAEGRVGSVGNN